MALQAPFIPQFFDIQSGALVPAAAYFLDTFESGTTTPKTTYADQAEGATNTNPIVLDSAGKCDLWLGDGEYTFRLRRTVALGGGTVDTWDDIAGIPVPVTGDFLPLIGGETMTGLFSLSGNATSNLNPVPKQQLDAAIAGVQAAVLAELEDPIPIGSVMGWFTGTPPTGWLKCNGTSVSRTTYADLFALWGTTYGSGDGSTTFGVPETRGEFLRGFDDGRGIDSGRAIGTLQTELLPAHTHTVLAGGSGIVADGNTANPGGGIADRTSQTTGSTGGTELRPRNVAVMLIVKAL